MKKIVKQSEPISLTEHRSKPYADYDNYSDKDKLRESLLEEQGYICCHCMSRIKMGQMKRQWFRVMSKKKHCNICHMELVVKDKL